VARTFPPDRHSTRAPPFVPLDSAPSEFADPLDEPPVRPSLAPAAGMGMRIVALVGGLLLLVAAMKATLGTVLLALLGMGLAWLLARRRGRTLTRGAGWWGAALGVAVGFVCFMAFMLAKAPPGTMARIRQSNDSIAASRPAKPPEWLNRIDPTGGKSAQLGDSASRRLVRSPAFFFWASAMGAVLAAALLGGILGTLGWGVGLLLAFGVTGRWLPRARAIVVSS